MKISGGSFDSLFYFTPAVSLCEVRVSDRATGGPRRLGWCVNVAWLVWEIHLEWLNAEGRQWMKGGRMKEEG